MVLFRDPPLCYFVVIMHHEASRQRHHRAGLALPAVLLALAGLPGCMDPPSEYGPVQADVFVEDEYHFEELWDTTLRVLRQWNLEPDRQDPRAGVITTKPITSQQWFEFWRYDAIGPYQWAEASLHTIQRVAVVKIDRTEERGRYRVTVKVEAFRHSSPERQVTTPSGALIMYSEKLPTEDGELLEPWEAVHWVRLGRDPRMEGVLLRRILNHYSGEWAYVEQPEEVFEEEMPLEQETPTGDEIPRTSPRPAESPRQPKGAVPPVAPAETRARPNAAEPVGPIPPTQR